MKRASKQAVVEIYGLFDEDGTLRYIGKANNAARRFAGHRRDVARRNTPVYVWLRKLVSTGRQPVMRVLETCEESDWKRAERQLIFEARLRGERLLNVADGGDQPKSSPESNRQNAALLNASIPLIKGYRRMCIELGNSRRFFVKQNDEARCRKIEVLLAYMRSFSTAEKIAFSEKILLRFPSWL